MQTLIKRKNIVIHVILLLAMIGISPFAVVAITANNVAAAPATVPINMCYYGWMNNSTEQAVIDARPEFFIGSSEAGPWKGNANISKLQAAGIKYFEYIDVAYVGYSTYPRAIPTDLKSNLRYIEAAAQAGAYGIFVDEVCDGIYTTPDYDYLEQIADKAHSLGLKVVFNVSVSKWADELMDHCDYINSSETWQGEALSPCQKKWASRTWLLTYDVYDADTAIALTNSALNQGIKAHYACSSYMASPGWLGTYITQISSTSDVPAPEDDSDPASTGQTSVTFSSNPTGAEVWLDYSYKGVTPLTIDVAAGNHYMGFYKYGYNNNLSNDTDFSLSGQQTLHIDGDMVAGSTSVSH